MTRNRCSAVALSLVAVAWSTSASAQTVQVDPTAELDRIVADVTSESTTTVALAKASEISSLSSYVPRSVYAEKVTAAANEAKDPFVAFELYQSAAWGWSELKDERWGATGMSGPLGKQGCLVDWEVVGPFDNPSMEGFARTFGPELGEIGPYEGKLADVDWRPLGDTDRYCEFNLGRAVQPTTAAVAYLGSTVSMDATTRGFLSVGVNGAYKIWLNGEFIGSRDEDTGMIANDDLWPVRLKAGENKLLVKVASTQDGGLGVVARLTDTRLRPINPAAVKANKGLIATDATGSPKMDRRSLSKQVKANAESLTGDAAVWNARQWSKVAWQDAAVPWRDVAERLLEDPTKLSPRGHAMLATLFEEYWEELDILKAAAARAPDDPWIALELAQKLENSITEPDRMGTGEMYRQLLAKHPGYYPALFQLADWYKARGLSERGLAELESFDDARRLDISGFGIRYVALLKSVGEMKTAAAAERDVWNSTFVSSGYLWNRVRELAHARKNAEAIALIDEYLKFVPHSQYARERQAELYRASGAPDKALAIYDELIARSPGDPDNFEEKARLLLALERQDEALSTLREALKNRPQDQDIRDLIAFLQPRENRMYEPWIIDEVREVAKNFAPSPFNYDTILDNSVTFVSKNGLASSVYQRVDRVLNPEGVDAVKSHRASYQMGDEAVEVIAVKVYKPDGTVSEDYDKWDSGGTRKGSTTYNDTGYVTMRANDVEIGDMVEFRYRVSQVANENFRGDYFGDIAYLQGGRPIAMQRYAVVYPADWKLYFRAPKLKHNRSDGGTPSGADLPDGFQSTSFTMTDVPYVESDPSQPGYSDVYDYLLVSNKKTYDEIGKWWWSLVKEQLIVDEPIRKKVAELTNGLSTADQKLRAIHNYVVKNTRYLHVGLGIHGWKPYRTSTCFRNRYGDCKDKAALLKVMLEEAGIPANLVLVRTRRLGSVEQVPASMHVFNHAITYVPSMDLYLDGTAEFNGTRELTTMDQGAQALIVRDGGDAEMVTLPVDPSKANVMKMEIEVDLTGDEPVATGKLVATGANAVYMRQALEDPERRDEAFEKQLADEFPGAKLVSAEYRNLSELEKSTEVDFVFRGGQLLRDDGNRESVLPVGRPKNLLDAYAKQSKRNQDLSIRVPFTSATKIRYRLGPTKGFDAVPTDKKIDGKFGSLKVDYEPDGQDLVVDVEYSIDEQRIAVEDYDEFRSFLTEVTAALNESVAVEEKQ